MTASAPLSWPDGTYLSGVRVLVLTSGHEALDGRVYAREAVGLRRMGADVTVVGRVSRGTPGEVPVLAIPVPSSRLSRFLLAPWSCLWAARRLRPDIVHFHDAEMLSVLPFARLLWRRARFVYDVHEDFANLMLVRDWLPRGLKPIVRALTEACEKTLARFADGIVAVTPPLAERFPRHARVVAFNYATPDFFREAARSWREPQSREFDLVHLGTLNRRRADFLAAVLREYHARRPSSRSLIVGAEPNVVGEVAGRLPRGCEIIGRVPFDSVPSLLGNARVGIDVHPWQEPHLAPALAVKICEYMACGCAVVASPMPVLEQVLAGSGLEPDAIALVRGDAPRDYAEAAERLVDAAQEGQNPGAQLRAFAREHMSWEAEGLKIARFYRELLRLP